MTTLSSVEGRSREVGSKVRGTTRVPTTSVKGHRKNRVGDERPRERVSEELFVPYLSFFFFFSFDVETLQK